MRPAYMIRPSNFLGKRSRLIERQSRTINGMSWMAINELDMKCQSLTCWEFECGLRLIDTTPFVVEKL